MKATRMLLTLLLAGIVTSCEPNAVQGIDPVEPLRAKQATPQRSMDIVIIPLFVQDAAGNPIDPATVSPTAPWPSSSPSSSGCDRHFSRPLQRRLRCLDVPIGPT